jgi:hypothetical protein
MKRATYWALSTAGGLLCLTGLAKVISALGSSQVLALSNPIFFVQNRVVFAVVGAIELAVGLYCLKAQNIMARAIPIAFLATDFLVYRFGLWWVGYQKPCSCMGSFTDAIHLSATAANQIMQGVLVYLLAVSYGVILVRTLRRPPSGPGGF